MELVLPKPGRYVVAVSGGIDSVCLLDILVSAANYDLIVAHYDHGIREDSHQDMEFVAGLAEKYGLEFVPGKGKLGEGASEDSARKARYAFLEQTLQAHAATALITAHHQDDRLETLLINLIRGTGRMGVSSISETKLIKRPFLGVSKKELKDYANQHNLSWREDSTNRDERYLRNYLRIHVLTKLSSYDRDQLVKLMDMQTGINKEIDGIINGLLVKTQERTKLDRRLLSTLPYEESRELVAAWLRYNNLAGFDRKMIDRLTLAAKTKRAGAKIDVYSGMQITLNKDHLALHSLER